MKSKIENCLYMQVAHCNKCGGQSGYNIIDGEKVCFDCGEPYEADFSVSKVETTITTTNSQDQEEERYDTRKILLNGTKPLEVEDTPEEIDNTKLVMPPSAYEQAEKEGFDMSNKVKSELLPEDTPEGWKGDIFTRFSWVGDTSEKSRRRLVDYIQQLLEDREREVVERFYEIVCKHNEYIGDDYATYLGNPTVLLGELYEAVLLSKLNNKKK